jgi:protein CpxP
MPKGAGGAGGPAGAGETGGPGGDKRAGGVRKGRTARGMIRVAVCLVGIGLMEAAFAGAQTADPAQGGGTGAATARAGRGGRGAGMRPAPNGLLGGLMLEQLNLTDAQKDQVKGIVDAHRADVQALMERLGTARRNLESAISADVADEGAIRARAGDVASVDADMAVMRARIRGQVFQILTPDQQTALKNLEARRHDRASHHGAREKR